MSGSIEAMSDPTGDEVANFVEAHMPGVVIDPWQRQILRHMFTADAVDTAALRRRFAYSDETRRGAAHLLRSHVEGCTDDLLDQRSALRRDGREPDGITVEPYWRLDIVDGAMFLGLPLRRGAVDKPTMAAEPRTWPLP